MDTLGNTVYKEDVVRWSKTVLKKEKVEDLKRQCLERAKDYVSSRCECEN